MHSDVGNWRQPSCGDLTLSGLVQVLHLGMDVTGSGMRYSPGDSIGVVAQVCDHTAAMHLKFC
jgi:hypothetical protein